LFPGKPAHYLGLVLTSAMHFVFILVVAAVALEPFMPHPGRMAFAAAALVTACIALGFYLDGRERATGRRWSLWFFGFALLLTLPLGVLALLLAAGGEDFHTQLVQAAAGSGSIAAVLALAARVGLIAAVRIGLGGRFGGGGAGRSE
jgi:drug/metabolite transporter (DMT)-like permease